MMLEIFTTGPVETHAILVGCSRSRKAVIFDAPKGSTPLLIEAMKRHALSPEIILLTHSHWDHLADVKELKAEFDIPVYVHAEDAENLRVPGSDGLPLFFPIPGVSPDGFVVEGQNIEVGDLEIEVIHTPGHTPGGVCYWIQKEKLLISGDTLFKGTMGNLSFPTGQPEKMVKSLNRLSRLPRDTTVIPGHGAITTIGAESWIEHGSPYTPTT